MNDGKKNPPERWAKYLEQKNKPKVCRREIDNRIVQEITMRDKTILKAEIHQLATRMLVMARELERTADDDMLAISCNLQRVAEGMKEYTGVFRSPLTPDESYLDVLPD